MKGRHLRDTPFGRLPRGRHRGDYWKYLHPTTGEPMEPYSNIDSSGNLTQTVWGFMSPLPGGGVGTLMIHTVREHEDGTISVRPGDGSSNSVLHHGGPWGEKKEIIYHGYIEHGVWSEV